MNSNTNTARKLLSLIPIVIAALFMMAGVLVLAWIGREKNTVLNAPMSEIELRPLLSCDDTPLSEDLMGRVTVFHFWGTWCPPCRSEYPEFAALMKGMSENKGFRCISVSCSGGAETDLDELAQETANFLKQNQIEMPIYSDPAAFTRGQLASRLAKGGFVYPMTIVVDQKGIIRRVWRGQANMQALERTILTLLASSSS